MGPTSGVGSLDFDVNAAAQDWVDFVEVKVLVRFGWIIVPNEVGLGWGSGF